ncbi:MAG: beta-ketoacyl-[acyl-carrier-protein] synthase family protein [Myxococcales bacterium]|nr:beta-ketoacyl-[acyl-carrier-protein] synthase family protein [Myxococcales bacterium]
MMRRVFVTGIGVVSPVGFGHHEFGSALLEGRSGAAPIQNFDASGFDRQVACEVKGFRSRDFLTAAEARRTGRCSAMALAAARMAVEEAGLKPEHLAGPRTAVILGTTMGEANVLGELESTWLHQGESSVLPSHLPRYGTTLLPIHVARAFGARGMVQTMPAACAAGNYAIGYASDQIRAGRADIAITGASEVIEKLQFAGFVRLGAMAPDVCRPFDQQRRGLIIGEGSGILVLESEESVVRRGATVLAEVGGYGLACDAHHITRPHPEGEGSRAAMRAAISSSGLDASAIDFVNAHGTGTPANDKIEAHVMHEIFGDRLPLTTSNKSILGHCMGAASALEAVSCILTLRDGMIPPTLNYETPDPECVVNLVANEARAAKVDVVLNNSAAFGGYDAVVAFARPGVLPPPRDPWAEAA